MMRVSALLLAGFMVAAVATGDEQERPGRGGRYRGEPREIVETVRLARLADELDLTDEEVVKLVRRFNAMRETQKDLARAHSKSIDDLRELLDDDAEAGEIEAQLAEVRENEAEVLRHRWTGFDEVVEGLDAEQRAKLYIFAQDFEADMRRLVERARSMHWEGRRERPGGPEEGWRGPPRDGPRDTDSPWRSWPRMNPDEWEERVQEWRELEPREREEWMRQWRRQRGGAPFRDDRDDSGHDNDGPHDGAENGHDDGDEGSER